MKTTLGIPSSSIIETIKQIQDTNTAKFKQTRINHATETPTGNSVGNLFFSSVRDTDILPGR